MSIHLFGQIDLRDIIRCLVVNVFIMLIWLHWETKMIIASLNKRAIESMTSCVIMQEEFQSCYWRSFTSIPSNSRLVRKNVSWFVITQLTLFLSQKWDELMMMCKTIFSHCVLSLNNFYIGACKKVFDGCCQQPCLLGSLNKWISILSRNASRSLCYNKKNEEIVSRREKKMSWWGDQRLAIKCEMEMSMEITGEKNVSLYSFYIQWTNFNI